MAAFDVATDGLGGIGLMTLSWAHVCSGVNRKLYVGLQGPDAGEGAGVITGVTYNGVAMTQIDSKLLPPGDRYAFLYELINPAAGSHTVTITRSAPGVLQGLSCSYMDVGQVVYNAKTTAESASAASITPGLTTLAPSWLILVTKVVASEAVADTGATRRIRSNDLAMFDSNGTVNGVVSMTVKTSSGGASGWAAVMAATEGTSPITVIARA